jgi:hypothetical protein
MFFADHTGQNSHVLSRRKFASAVDDIALLHRLAKRESDILLPTPNALLTAVWCVSLFGSLSSSAFLK